MKNKIQRQTRTLLWFFIVALFLSGLSAIPVEQELNLLQRIFPAQGNIGAWLDKVYQGVSDTNTRYPFIAYGYDWLAFAHFVLAILFIGPVRDPVKNKWVIEFGLIACVLVIPFAFIAGHYRGIPLIWTLIDCSFGVIGLIPLFMCLKRINLLASIEQKEKNSVDNMSN